MNEISCKFDEFKETINPYKDKAESAYNLIDAFNYAKEVIEYKNYEYVKDQLLKLQRNMPMGFLIKTNTKFRYNKNWTDFKNKTTDSFENEKALLDYIVSVSRNYVVSYYSNGTSIDDIDFQGMCGICSKNVRAICDKLNIKNKIVKIEPGFNSEYNLFDGFRYHYFNIITINDRDYIIDCSYKQFFDINVSLLEQNGIYGYGGALCGIYMINDKNRLKTAKELLNNGWILMDENNFKNYLDGFSISFRNASYYYDLGKLDYSTNYTANDYENFLFGDDDQGKHESLEHLGKQKRLVKNPSIIFKTDEKILKKIY